MKLHEDAKRELRKWCGETDSHRAIANVYALLEYVEYMEDRCEKIATLLRQEMVARVTAEKKLMADGPVTP